MKLFLDQKVRIAFVFAVLALLLLGTSAYYRMAALDETNRRVLHTHEVLADVQDLRLDVKSVYLSSSAFALTGENTFIVSYNVGLKSIERDQASIRNLMADNAAAQSRLPAIDGLATENIKSAETMIALRMDNGPADVVDIERRASQASAEKFDAAVGKLREEELRLLTQYTATTNRELSEVKLILFIGIILCTFITGVAAWGIPRHARTASELRDSEEGLRLLLDGLQDYAIFTLDQQGQVVSWNAGAERVKGYTAQQIIGQNFSRFFPQREVTQHRPEEILRMAAVFGRFEESAKRVRKDGSEFLASVTDTALHDIAGNLRGFSVICHDLTAIQQSEARYRGLLEAAPDGMVVVNQSGKITLLNAQAEKQFGYRRDELLGQNVRNIIPEGFAERRIADGTPTPGDVLVQEIGMVIETQGIHRNGTRFPIEIMLSPLEIGEEILVTAGIRDITMRKDAERHLVEMEARYRGLLEAAPDGMVVVNRAGEIVLLNARAETLFGYRRDELLDQNVKDIIPEGFAERLSADALRSTAEALAQQIGMGIELLGRRKDGTEFPIEIMLSPLESAEGVLVTAAIRDISERKQLARQLHQSQKMEAVGQLTGGIAHDFNNLLTVIIGNLGLLELLVPDNEAAVKRIRTAQKAAKRGADITRRLLVFSSVEELKPASVLLEDSIQNMIEMSSRALGSDIKITTQLDRTVPRLFVDPAALESALLNLVVNARDAMPKGGSILVSSLLQNLDCHHPAVRAGDLKEGCYVCVGVTDTGQGMSPETLERAFEPFFTTKRRDKGTGLGLAMVYGFAKQSGGIVRICSELGHGTTVSFYLPIVTDQLHLVHADTPKPFNSKLTGTVLVVDDEADVLELAIIYLNEIGITGIQAKDGASALKTIAQGSPIDLMITDVVMPGGMNGAELVQKAHVLCPSLKIIYSSGFSAEALAEKAMVLSDGPLLRKPYQRAEFAGIVRSVLESGHDVPREMGSSIPAKYFQPVSRPTTNESQGATGLTLNILVVDDDPHMGEFVCATAQAMGFQCTMTTNAKTFLENLSADTSLIILDLMMPETDGIELLRLFGKRNCKAGVVLMSGVNKRTIEAAGEFAQVLGLSIVGRLQKPFQKAELEEILRRLPNAEPPTIVNTNRPLAIQKKDLQIAILKNEFVVYYQPQIDLASRRVIGVEALVRWRNPSGGLIFPDSFIGSMEKFGLIDELGWIVANRGLNEVGRFSDGNRYPITLSLNASVNSLCDINFPDTLVSIAEKHGVSPVNVTIEITETGLIKKLASTLDTLTRLRMKEVKLSIDDFGTGYAMMRQFKTIPATELKIDKSFVQEMTGNDRDRIMVQKTIEMGHELGIKVVAEGVETQEQLDLLRSFGCDIAQGYLFSRAVPAAEMESWLKTYRAVRTHS